MGLNFRPSILQLNATWGARWKAGAEIQYYYCRLPIIKAIECLHVSGEASTLLEAAARLETVWLSINMSLNRFAVWCAESEKKDDGIKNINSKHKRQAWGHAGVWTQ